MRRNSLNPFSRRHDGLQENEAHKRKQAEAAATADAAALAARIAECAPRRFATVTLPPQRFPLRRP